MIRIDHIPDSDIVAITVSEKLTKADYDQWLPVIEQYFEKHAKLRFLIKLVDFAGFEFSALWEDLKFDRKHMDQYGKTAVVGDTNWEEWGTRLAALFFSNDMKFFHTGQENEAWAWLKGVAVEEDE